MAPGRNNPAYFFPGSNIHRSNSLGRESNIRNNTALSVVKVIYEQIGKLCHCLGSCWERQMPRCSGWTLSCLSSG